MKTAFLPFHMCLSVIASASIAAAACGSDQEPVVALRAEQAAPDDAHPHASGASPGHDIFKSADDFPPPAPGYTRFVAPVVKDVAPGEDVIRCQYVQAPLDHDVDILDVQGYQSLGGHHAVAYATTANAPVGTSRDCAQDDNLNQGGFLGGVGGEAGGATDLPEGVAFRLPKGSAIMLNTHFLNTSDDPFDGYTVLDIKFAETDKDRLIASMFVNGNMSFQVPARGAAEAVAECKMPREMKFVMFTNHMHDQGASAITEVVRADGSVALIHEDPKWSYEMQFKAVYTRWPVDKALTLAPGDVVRTRCRWQNSLAEDLRFPREMCFGVGFFLSDGSTAPTCANGIWLER